MRLTSPIMVTWVLFLLMGCSSGDYLFIPDNAKINLWIEGLPKEPSATSDKNASVHACFYTDADPALCGRRLTGDKDADRIAISDKSENSEGDEEVDIPVRCTDSVGADTTGSIVAASCTLAIKDARPSEEFYFAINEFCDERGARLHLDAVN